MARITNKDGVWEVDGNLRTLVEPSTTYQAEVAAAKAVADAAEAKTANSRDRIKVLGTKAAKHAKNTSNPALTTRETNELLARLALAELADDQ